jgi:tRNA-specific 2-thiouridylase
MSRRIAVAVSGGVDSLIAASLLKDEPGTEVFAVHFITGFEQALPAASAGAPPRPHPVQAIADQLGIGLHVIDARAAFRENVVEYFIADYLSGRTPNPCIVCNPTVKFGAVLERAEALGADALATGHYARMGADPCGRPRLFKGADPQKDQSYFLARLTPHQLTRAVFPLAGMTKGAVRALAARRGLRPVASEESQDVCFIKGRSYREFIARQAGGAAFAPGLIENLSGEVLGEHPGLHTFTVGQRRGINCPAAEPWYAVRLDTRRNRLVVGTRADLLTRTCRVGRINWIAPAPRAPLQVHTRVRYRSPEAPSTFSPSGPREGKVAFDAPQAAVTPGQAAVFYRGDEVLGAGFIETEDVGG